MRTEFEPRRLRWSVQAGVALLALGLAATGMPTLRAIGEISHATGKPVLSSNLCLAWALGKHLHLGGRPPWEDRKWESQLHSL